jgi:hypothetical protein
MRSTSDSFLAVVTCSTKSAMFLSDMFSSLGYSSTARSYALSSASFRVKGFASVSGDPPAVTYTTRSLNLSWGREGYAISVLSPFLEPDFSPDVTILRFPDAYSATFRDVLLIPGITHST